MGYVGGLRPLYEYTPGAPTFANAFGFYELGDEENAEEGSAEGCEGEGEAEPQGYTWMYELDNIEYSI